MLQCSPNKEDLKMKLLILLALIVSELTLNGWCQKQEHSYTVSNEDIISFEGEEGETFVDFTNIKTVGRQRKMNGSMTFLEDMDADQYKLEVQLWNSPSGDGEWYRMAMGFPPTAICEAFAKFYVQFVQPSFINGENTDFPFVGDDGLCPIPAGTYSILEIVLNTEDWPQNVPRGIIKAVCNFLKNDVIVGGVNIIVKIQDR